MSLSHAVVQIPDLKSVENFLMSLPYVTDASVWLSKGRLMAHITVPMSETVSPNAVRAACLNELGVHLTPEEVYLIEDRDLVA
jgi:hypothetical protein